MCRRTVKNLSRARKERSVCTCVQNNICSTASPNFLSFQCVCVMGLSSMQRVEPVPDEFLQRPCYRLSAAALWDRYLPFTSTWPIWPCRIISRLLGILLERPLFSFSFSCIWAGVGHPVDLIVYSPICTFICRPLLLYTVNIVWYSVSCHTLNAAVLLSPGCWFPFSGGTCPWQQRFSRPLQGLPR